MYIFVVVNKIIRNIVIIYYNTSNLVWMVEQKESKIMLDCSQNNRRARPVLAKKKLSNVREYRDENNDR